MRQLHQLEVGQAASFRGGVGRIENEMAIDHPNHHLESLLRERGPDTKVKVKNLVSKHQNGFGVMKITFENGDYYWIGWRYE